MRTAVFCANAGEMKRSEVIFNVLRVPADFTLLVLAGVFVYVLRVQILDAWWPVLFGPELPLDRYLGMIVGIAALLFMVLMSFAQAQTPTQMMTWCATGESVDKSLRGVENQEVVRFAGTIVNGNGVFMIYANAETNTWSLVVFHTDGRTCMVSAGTGFEFGDTDLFPPKGDKV